RCRGGGGLARRSDPDPLLGLRRADRRRCRHRAGGRRAARAAGPRDRPRDPCACERVSLEPRRDRVTRRRPPARTRGTDRGGLVSASRLVMRGARPAVRRRTSGLAEIELPPAPAAVPPTPPDESRPLRPPSAPVPPAPPSPPHR